MFLMAGLPQEESQEWGDTRCLSPGSGVIPQILLFCRSPRKPLMRYSSSAWCRHSNQRTGECLVRNIPKPQCPGWTRAAPSVWVVRPTDVSCLLCCRPEPTASSCIFVPCSQEQSPHGLFSMHLSPFRTQQEAGVSVPLALLCLHVYLNLSPTGLLAGRPEWALGGRRTEVLGGGTASASW